MRTCAVYNGTCQKPITQGGYDAPIHVCIGNGGMNLTPIPSTKATWTEYQAAIYGYSTIEVNTTHLHVRIHFIPYFSHIFVMLTFVLFILSYIPIMLCTTLNFISN